MKRLLLVASLIGAAPALADEGMWTYNNFPASKVKAAYGFEPSQDWLDKTRLSSAKFGNGCSSSFVSPDGLVMTNHHCARGCIQQLSTADKDFIANGFYAKAQAEELQCPALEVSQLVDITDVTDKLNTATKGLTGKAYADTLKAEMAKLEKDCTTGADVRCDVVTLYQGGKYNLYKYQRYQDVRLVFAPEQAIAFFGGDPDNFEFPRYDLDVSFVRVYKDGKPAKTDNYFKWSAKGAKDGELTFVSGHPGRTSRGLTVAQLEYLRDVQLPKQLFKTSELRGLVTEFQNRGPEQKRISTNLLFMVENSLKATKGKHEQLVDKNFFAQKVAAEQELRKKVNANPKMKAKYGAAWDEIARAQGTLRNIRKEYDGIEAPGGINSQLFGLARTLVRASDELPKPDAERLRGFNEANLPQLKNQLLSKAPIYPELEIAQLTFSFTKLREELGPDHPLVKKALGTESPASLAARVVKGSTLADPKVREQLFTGGKAAITASQDPMIQLAALIDPDARAIRKVYEEQVEAVVRKNSELIAQAKFEVYGTGIYPDATGTLRLSYGSVKGYTEDGKKVEPITVMGGTFDRHTGEEPFALPKTWLAAQKDLTATTPMNFVTTNDIIGGNSGSPLINKDREIVGLAFDGNIQSLGGDYGYDGSANRTVAVHSEALIEALKKIYKADRVIEELRPSVKASPGL